MKQIFIDCTTFQKKFAYQLNYFVKHWKLKHPTGNIKLVAIHEYSKPFAIKPSPRTYQLCVFDVEENTKQKGAENGIHGNNRKS